MGPGSLRSHEISPLVGQDFADVHKPAVRVGLKNMDDAFRLWPNTRCFLKIPRVGYQHDIRSLGRWRTQELAQHYRKAFCFCLILTNGETEAFFYGRLTKGE